MHACWIDWRETTLQTTALLALAGAVEKFEPDAHEYFNALYAPPDRGGGPKQLTPQERAQRYDLIRRLAGG